MLALIFSLNLMEIVAVLETPAAPFLGYVEITFGAISPYTAY